MNNNRQFNYFFSRSWNLSFVYFTTWALLLQVFYYFGVLKRYQESILLITASVAFLGAVLVYIYPRKVKLQQLDIEIKGHEYQIIDLLCHQIPLILLLVFYDPKIKPDNLIFAAAFILLYTIVYNPFKIYTFDKNMNKNIVVDKKSSELDQYLFGNKRYYVASFMIFAYFVLLIIAIKIGVFK